MHPKKKKDQQFSYKKYFTKIQNKKKLSRRLQTKFIKQTGFNSAPKYIQNV